MTHPIDHHQQSPIIIDLSGRYFSSDDKPTPKGSISGDLRLASLDAFIHTLDDALKNKPLPDQDPRLEIFLSKIAKTMKEENPTSSLEIEIVSKLDPENNELTYKFRFNTH